MRNLILILLFVSAQADAQKISFVDTTNEWYVLNTFWATSSGVSISMFTLHHYFYSGSKKINNNDYQVVVRSSQSVKYSVYNNDTQSIIKDSNIAYHYVRKDTVSGDIYATISDTSTNEFRLYHNQANVGDTLKTQNIAGAYLFQIVDSIKTVSINNQSYQIYYVMCRANSYGRYAYIDGLGSLSDPFQLSTPSPVPIVSSSNVTCFRNRYGYLQSSDIILNCQDTTINKYLRVPQDNTNMIVQAHKVYPQPATTQASIQLPQAIKSGMLHLYNQVGQTLHTEAIRDNAQVRVNAPATPGLYYYSVLDNTTGQAWQGKILFE